MIEKRHGRRQRLEQLAELRDTARSWWDERFTALLLEAIPADCRQIVEYGCGDGRAARALLPVRPDACYIGIETETDPVREAQQAFSRTKLASRVQFQLGRELDLPLPDGSADLMLALLRLQHCRDVEALLGEMRRVLRREGTLLIVEADNLGQRFYFDGVLEEINTRLHALTLRVRVARQPADIAIGPRLPLLLRGAGFHAVSFRPHSVGSTRREEAKLFCRRLERICDQLVRAGGLDEQGEEVVGCREAIRRLMFAGMPKRLGYSAHIVPLFLVSGTVV